jgi:hypothetical protein
VGALEGFTRRSAGTKRNLPGSWTWQYGQTVLMGATNRAVLKSRPHCGHMKFPGQGRGAGALFEEVAGDELALRLLRVTCVLS